MLSTPSASYRQLPPQSRRPSLSPSERPSTSSGEKIEPKSDFLRDALREKKGLPPRARSTTPRRARIGLKSQAFHDDWMPTSEDESKTTRRHSFRPQRPRRASDIIAGGLQAQNRSLGAREADARMDKLEKENWDLKHRIALQQERATQLNEQLEQALEQLERTRTVREEAESLKTRVTAADKEIERLKTDNVELTELNDDLVKELEVRDREVEERQLAIEEAAGIIQKMEMRIESMAKAAKYGPANLLSSPDRLPDSDYFSADNESIAASTRPPSSRLNAQHLSAHDSDYFSAENSPRPPRTPAQVRSFAASDSKLTPAQLQRAKTSAASFNRELGLRSAASKDSLLAAFLDQTRPAPIRSQSHGHSKSSSQISAPSSSQSNLRTLRRRTPTPGPASGLPPTRSATSIPPTTSAYAPPSPIVTPAPPTPRATTPVWPSSSRPLRNLFLSGELARPVHGVPAQAPPSPSVTCASTVGGRSYGPSPRSSNISTRSSGDDDAFSRIETPCPGGASLSSIRQRSMSQSPATTVSDLVSTSGHSISKPRPIPTAQSVNYNAWPRKYPAWPPSASLVNRDLLYHGSASATTLDDLYGVSPPSGDEGLPGAGGVSVTTLASAESGGSGGVGISSSIEKSVPPAPRRPAPGKPTPGTERRRRSSFLR